MVVLYLPTFLTLKQYQYLLSEKDEIIEYGKDFHMLSIYQVLNNLNYSFVDIMIYGLIKGISKHVTVTIFHFAVFHLI